MISEPQRGVIASQRQDRQQARVAVSRPSCAYCHDAVDIEDEKTGCVECMTWSHSECVANYRRCPACKSTAPVSSAIRPTQRGSGLGPLALGALAAFFVVIMSATWASLAALNESLAASVNPNLLATIATEFGAGCTILLGIYLDKWRGRPPVRQPEASIRRSTGADTEITLSLGQPL